MTTRQATIDRHVDEQIAGYIKRLIARATLAARSATRVHDIEYSWDHIGQVAFISRDEWSLLLDALGTTGDATLMKRIEDHPLYASALVGRYSFLKFTVVNDPSNAQSYCTIQTENLV